MHAAGWTALGTWVAVAMTVYLVRNQIRSGARLNCVSLQLRLHEHFWGSQMLRARKRLAEELLRGAPDRDKVQEHVMNYYELVGMLLRRHDVDIELVWNSEGYYGPLWWAACKSWISEERRRAGDRLTLFENFGWLSDTLVKYRMKRNRVLRPEELVPSMEEIQRFLRDEAALG